MTKKSLKKRGKKKPSECDNLYSKHDHMYRYTLTNTRLPILFFFHFKEAKIGPIQWSNQGCIHLLFIIFHNKYLVSPNLILINTKTVASQAIFLTNIGGDDLKFY